MVLQVAAVPGLPILAAGVARQRAIDIRVCRRLAGTPAGRDTNTPRATEASVLATRCAFTAASDASAGRAAASKSAAGSIAASSSASPRLRGATRIA
jgi:hypothetical protein